MYCTFRFLLFIGSAIEYLSTLNRITTIMHKGREAIILYLGCNNAGVWFITALKVLKRVAGYTSFRW